MDLWASRPRGKMYKIKTNKHLTLSYKNYLHNRHAPPKNDRKLCCGVKTQYWPKHLSTVRSHVWKFGLDCLKLEVCKISGGEGRSPLLGGGHMWAAMPTFVHGRAISVKSLVVKIWFGLVEPFKSFGVGYTDKKKNKNKNKKNHERDWKQYLRKKLFSGGQKNLYSWLKKTLRHPQCFHRVDFFYPRWYSRLP